MADTSKNKDLADVNVIFHNYSLHQNARNPACCCVYVGEILRYDVVINKPKEADLKSWKRRVSQLCVHACVAPLEKTATSATATSEATTRAGSERQHGDSKNSAQHEKNGAVVCSVVTTYIDPLDKKSLLGSGSSQREKFYFKDSNSCVVPMSTCVWNTTGQCQQAQLFVSLWLTASPQKRSQDADIKKDFQLSINSSPTSGASGRKCVEQKSVTKPLCVRDPPHLKVRFVSCGQQHLLLVQVLNTSHQTITIKNMTIVPSTSPSCDHREFFNTSHSHKDRYIIQSPQRMWKYIAVLQTAIELQGHWSVFYPGPLSQCLVKQAGLQLYVSRSGADSWQQLVSLALSGGNVFPVVLAGREEMAFIYRLDLSPVSSDVELAFHSYLRWTHPGTNKEINTVFRLPKLRLRYPAFTVTVKCEGPVETGKTFYLTYNISNNLQDFLSVRLYWNLDTQLGLLQGSDDPEMEQEKQKLEAVKRAIICHDPDVFIGWCPRGCSMPVSVGFQILQPGLYEFGELMKLNLRWALPDSQSTLKQDSVGTPVSSDTVSTLSADDQLLASTELWRDRSGSTCSLQTPTSHSAEERRKTFATKSYSFGDLGPTQSADSDDSCRLRFKSIKRSSAVMPPRPPPPGNLSQPEKELTNRNNFLKKSFKIYIPTGC